MYTSTYMCVECTWARWSSQTVRTNWSNLNLQYLVYSQIFNMYQIWGHMVCILIYTYVPSLYPLMSLMWKKCTRLSPPLIFQFLCSQVCMRALRGESGYETSRCVVCVHISMSTNLNYDYNHLHRIHHWTTKGHKVIYGCTCTLGRKHCQDTSSMLPS